MKRYFALLLSVVIMLLTCACAQSSEFSEDPVLEAYKSKAQSYIDSGDLETAVLVLEEGVTVTGSTELSQMLSDLKLQLPTTAATSAPTIPTTEAAIPTTEATTEAAIPTTEATIPTAAQKPVSNYPVQIDMEDLLSANILGETFLSAYDNRWLGEWMFLYVHGCSDPGYIYDAFWFDEELNQQTYYGILYYQAADAGWGHIWIDMTDGIAGSDFSTTPTSAPPVNTPTTDYKSFCGAWSTSGASEETGGIFMDVDYQVGSDGDYLLISIESICWHSHHLVAAITTTPGTYQFTSGRFSTYFQESGWGMTGYLTLDFSNTGSIVLTISSLQNTGMAWCALSEGTHILQRR